jgi:MFS family permease
MTDPAVRGTPPSPLAALTAVPGARKALILLVLINLMNYVDRQILSAVEEAIGKEYGVTATATGWLATAFLLAYMVFSPVFGVMADRVRRWAIVGVGVILWSLASGGSGAVTVFSHLVMMRLLIGIGEAAYGPVAPTLIADLYPVHIRGKVLAWFFAAIPVGSALGYVIGGLFEKWGHWHWAFYATVPPGILLGVWCFFMKEPPRAETEKKKATLADYLAILRIKSYTFDTLGMTAMTFAIGGVAFFMPRYLSGRPDIGLDPGTAKMVFGGIIVVAGLVATIAGGMAGDALRNRWSGSYFIVSAVGMLLGTPLFLLMLVTPFPACWVVIFLACFCLFFNTGPSNTILANVTRPAVRATAFALNILVIHAFGDAISPPIIGWVSVNFGGMGMGFAVVSFMMALGGVFWLFGAKFLEQDTIRANAPLEVVESAGKAPLP